VQLSYQLSINFVWYLIIFCEAPSKFCFKIKIQWKLQKVETYVKGIIHFLILQFLHVILKHGVEVELMWNFCDRYSSAIRKWN